MKNKKGFTLIELLAIIVILAIIAVITVPIILNIIENSKMGAASDSAYGFKDAVNKSYLTKLSGDSDYEIPNNTYTVNDLKTQIDLSLSGKEPSSNSWVTIEENEVTEGCLQYDEYKVELSDGKVTNTEKGKCEVLTQSSKLTLAVDSDSNGKISIGDEVKIGAIETFYVIDEDNSSYKLLAKYNLIFESSENEYRQASSTSVTNYVTQYFQSSGSSYWNNNVGEGHDYLGDYNSSTDTPYPYVYNSNSLLYSYVNSYIDFLSTEIEIPSTSFSGGLLTYEEANGLTLEQKNTGTSYWFGSAKDNNFVWIWQDTAVDCLFYSNMMSTTKSGIRPVVTVLKASL